MRTIFSIVGYLFIISLLHACSDGAKSTIGNGEGGTAKPEPVQIPQTQINVKEGNRRVTLTWEKVEGAKKYVIYWNDTGNVTSDDNKITDIEIPFVHNGLANDKTYYYLIDAYDDDDDKVAFSEQLSGTPFTPTPTSPINVSITAENSQITLNWEAVTDAAYFNIYYNKSGDVGTADLQVEGSDDAPIVSPSYTHRGLNNGETYYYVITSVNEGIESRPSVEATAIPSDTAGVPSNITVRAGESQAFINWNQVTGSNNYKIYFNQLGGITTSDVAYTDDVPPYVDTPLNQREKYYYAISAFDSSQSESSLSTEVSVTIPGPLPQKLDNFFLGSGNKQVTLNWIPNVNTLYHVYWDTEKNVTKADNKFTSVVPPYTHIGLENSTTYYYAIAPVNDNGEGEISNVLSATPHYGSPTIIISSADQTDSVAVDESSQFFATGGTGPYEWEIDNPLLADIDQNGLVSGLSVGTVLISVEDAEGYSGSTTINIVPPIISVTAQSEAVQVGSTLQFSAVGGQGPYTWSVNNPAIATINENGLLTGDALGSVIVTATDQRGYTGESGSISVQERVITVSAPSTSITGGMTLQFTASGGLEPYTWSVDDTNIASIDNAGLLTTGGNTGTIIVTAMDDAGFQGNSNPITVAAPTITVTSPVNNVGVDGTLQFSASGGNTPYTWSVSDPTLASINSSGLLTALAAGTVTVTVADAFQFEGSSQTITIIPPTIVVSFPSNAVQVGSTLQLSATGGIGPYTWSVNNGLLASINASGILTAAAEGSVVVTATSSRGYSGMSGQISLQPRTVTVTAPVYTVTGGSNLQLIAAGGIAPYTWSVNNSAIGSVNNAGLLSTGGTTGMVIVTATDSFGYQGSSSAINVIAPTISTSPNTANVTVDGTIQFSASGGTGPYTWSVNNPTMASINNSGLLTGLQAGSVVVTAQDSFNYSGSSGTITIDPPDISVSPPTSAIQVGETIQFTASGGIGPYTWSVDNPTLADINVAGLLTATAIGTVTVTATSSRGYTGTGSVAIQGRTVTVTAPSYNITGGSTLQFSANGGLIPYTWSVSDSAIATINGSGLMSTGANTGTVTVSATDNAGFIGVSNVVTVSPPNISVTSSATNVTVDGVIQFNASGGTAPYTWSVDDATVATINANGLLTAIKSGSVVVTATDNFNYPGNSGPITVNPPDIVVTSPVNSTLVGNTLQFSASGGIGPYTWEVNNTTFATINATSGLLTGAGVGTVVVTATSSRGYSGTSSIISIQARTVVVTAPSDTISGGSSLQFTASGGIAPYTWLVSSPAVASIDANGLVTTGGTIGNFTVTATDDFGFQGSSSVVTVNAPTITVSPATSTIQVDDTLQFSAVGGNIPFTWSVSNLSVASISDTGVLTALSTGPVVVTATDNYGYQGSSGTITVNPPDITVTPNTATLLAGDTRQFSASGGVGSYTWSVNNTVLASIDTNGLLTGKAVGTVQVTATSSRGYPGTSGDITLNARTVTVTAPKYSITGGQTLQFSASGGIAPYFWTVSNTLIASTNALGLISTGGVTGTFTVTAMDSLNFVGTSSTVTVTAPTITVSSPFTDVIEGGTLQFSASGGIPPYAWSVDNTTRATIDNVNGLLTAASAGPVVVTARDANNYPGSSTTINVLIPPPSAPLGVTATGGYTQVTLDWNPVNGATGYKVYRDTVSPVVISPTTFVSNVGTIVNEVGKIEFVNTNLVNTTTYYYAITASNGTGDSGGSLEVNATPDGHLLNTVNFPDTSFRNCLIATGVTYAEEITTALSCRNQNPAILTIEGVQFLSYVPSLDMTGNEISDATPLANLTQLTVLGLSSNNIDDTSNTSVIGNLINLEELYIYGQTGFQLSDVSWLSDLDKTKLRILGLTGQNLGNPATIGANMTALGSLGGVGTAMTNLTLSRNNFTTVSDISALGALVNLTSLGIDYNEFNSFAWLQNLSQLTFLNINSTQATSTDLSYISGMANLDSLYASFNADITNLGSLIDNIQTPSLINLTYISMRYSGLTDIGGLEYLTNLTYLDMDQNFITNAAPLSTLVNLRTLQLSGSQIGLNSILALQNLTQLTRIDISNNQISNVSELATVLSSLGNEVEHPVVMRDLILSNNLISDPDGSLTTLSATLTSLNSSLTDLFMADIGVTNVDGLSGMTNLDRLFLDNHPIATEHRNAIADVGQLATLVNLSRLELEDNNSALANLNLLNTLDLATRIALKGNPAVSCTEVDSLIAALGSPPVDLDGSTSSVDVTDPGVNCTLP